MSAPRTPVDPAASSVATCLWFGSDPEPAARFYASLFDGAEARVLNREMLPDGSLGHAFLAEVVLQGHRLVLMAGGPAYKLTPAASVQVMVETQDEVDRLWEALTAEGGAPGRCGWLTDRWGLSWQIIPRALPRLLALADREAAGRAMQAMMAMGKIDVSGLETAAAG